MTDPFQAERGLHGAVAGGWIEEQAPDGMAEPLFTILESWLADPARPPSHLWNDMAQALRGEGCLDAEQACWRALFDLARGEPVVALRLAEVGRLRGDEAEARGLAALVPPGHPARAAALLLRLEMGEGGVAAEADALLQALPGWEPSHHRFIRALVAAGRAEPARDFLGRWMAAHPPEGRDLLLELGWLAMHACEVTAARRLFERLWALNDPEITEIAGRFDGVVSPYDAAVERSIRDRIEAAFALPEDRLSRVPFGQGKPSSTRVLFVGFERLAMPNDLAEHYSCSARAAGVELSLYLDNAIVFPGEFKGGDAEVAGRVKAFETELERTRPHVVILDCAYMPNRRGLNPGGMRALADRLGFRLICMMRDALASTLDYLLAWGAVADTLLVYDPCSPILGPEHAPLRAEVLVGFTPAQHLDQHDGARDLGLLFVGSSSYGVRNMLLSVLMTEDIPFTAITGPARAERVPDLDAYAGLLRRARAVLNVAAHGRGEFLITGRVIEAMAAGAVLLEQDNPATARFFTPWRHYLPWTGVADIVQLCRFVERNPDQAARIVAEARSWLRRNYSAQAFWSMLLGSDQVP